MQIEILSVSVEDKGKYKMAEVAYKSDGKVSGKKLMSFGGGAEVFKIMTTAKTGDVFDIKSQKNDKGYWDWVGATQGGSGQSTSGGSSSMAVAQSPKSNYETAEERANRQVLIVRQSSLSNAVEFLGLNTKKSPTVQEVIAVAREFENYVFGKSAVPTPAATNIAEMDDDVPM